MEYFTQHKFQAKRGSKALDMDYLAILEITCKGGGASTLEHQGGVIDRIVLVVSLHASNWCRVF